MFAIRIVLGFQCKTPKRIDVINKGTIGFLVNNPKVCSKYPLNKASSVKPIIEQIINVRIKLYPKFSRLKV